VPSDRSLFSLSIPDFEIEHAVVCVIGQRGESIGLVLFESLDDFEEYTEAVAAFERREEVAMPPYLALNFDQREDLSPELSDEIRRYGWEIAGTKAYPWVVAGEAELLGRPPAKDELLLLEVAAHALADAVEKTPRLRTLWQANETLSLTSTVRTHEGSVTATLAAPYERAVQAGSGPRRPGSKPLGGGSNPPPRSGGGARTVKATRNSAARDKRPPRKSTQRIATQTKVADRSHRR
jgi:hypothetical protein